LASAPPGRGGDVDVRRGVADARSVGRVPAPGVDGDRWSGPAAAGRADASAPCKRGHRDANREIESNTSVRGTLRRVWPRGSMRWLMVMARWAGQSAGSRPVAHPGTTTIDGDGDHRTSLSSARASGCSPAPPQSESPTATACLAARIIMLLHPCGTQHCTDRTVEDRCRYTLEPKV
jgi:hypothetical protein